MSLKTEEIGVDISAGVAALLEKRAAQFPGRVSTDMPPGYHWWETR